MVSHTNSKTFLIIKVADSPQDNYQGEEAEIVIVSLTRSNSDGDIGFLAARERLNVLLSRARDCLIMIGNMETYMHSKKGKDTWVPFFESMKTKNHLYDGLPVRCERHPERKFSLIEPGDFDRFCPDGGCAEVWYVLLFCVSIPPFPHPTHSRTMHLELPMHLSLTSLLTYYHLYPLSSSRSTTLSVSSLNLILYSDVALNCGLHNCKKRCHRLTDHSQMPCPSKMEITCDRGHTLKVPCHMRKDKCSKCVQQDIETERRVKRDLKLEAERVIRQEAYKRGLAEIQDEIDHERRLIKYQQDDEDQKKTLLQQKADLDSLRATSDRISKAKAAPTVPKSFPPSDPPSPPESSGSFEIPDGARTEWDYMKRFDGAKSEPLDELIDMVGLEEVKLSFLGIKQRTDAALRRRIPLEKERFSCSMLGNPGTGKTTVARLYAKFLTSIGVIPGADFKEQTGASLANSGVNGCKKLIEDMLNNGGGVLFIDEAYQLTSGNSYGGGAVLDYLLAEVENLTGKIAFVLAGYNKQMESFYAHNPGLPSRFPISMKFDDYTDNELLSILALKIHQKYKGGMKCEDGTKGLYCRIVSRRIGRSRGKDMFGNARTVENTLSTIDQRQGRRIWRERRDGKRPDDLLFTKEDLIGPEPTEALGKSKAWMELQKLIGLTSVKEAVKALVDSVGENYRRELQEQPPIEYTLNKVFLGNPGTGKTTIAKIYGKILVDLGMLSKGEGTVASYLIASPGPINIKNP